MTLPRAVLAAAALSAAPCYGQDGAAFAPFEAKPVAGIEYTGNRVTRDFVIARELQTKVGEPFRLETLRLDLVRLENLGVFADTRVVPTAEGDSVRLGFDFREMPKLIVYPSFSYTEENGFSYGPALSTLNLGGQGIRLSAKVFFGGSSQRFARLDLALDHRQPRLVRLQRRPAGARRHPERVPREELGVHALARHLPGRARPPARQRRPSSA